MGKIDVPERSRLPRLDEQFSSRKMERTQRHGTAPVQASAHGGSSATAENAGDAVQNAFALRRRRCRSDETLCFEIAAGVDHPDRTQSVGFARSCSPTRTQSAGVPATAKRPAATSSTAKGASVVTRVATAGMHRRRPRHDQTRPAARRRVAQRCRNPGASMPSSLVRRKRMTIALEPRSTLQLIVIPLVAQFGPAC